MLAPDVRPFHYRYDKRAARATPARSSSASNASYISVTAPPPSGIVDRIPKASIGKSCVRF